MLEAHSLKNVTEELVLNQLELMKSNLPCCTCKRCCLDVAAIALNNLEPKYVVTKEGVLYSKLNASSPQQMADISSAIMHAALLVATHPRHPAHHTEEATGTPLAPSSEQLASQEPVFPENTVAVQADDPLHAQLRPEDPACISSTVAVQVD